ncbi:hypothetical protein EST38_g6140 [Candolleomyces aberdarensis]|uniref:Uncharacterized protein n=1 Tax=Candolleomyces aberdarensis TaxID=2316362 RepID=A0A4Q2DIN5_9AGAR|nr:hypothetical protein EST38_g6140 [Candolleomyces aberdarensis]
MFEVQPFTAYFPRANIHKLLSPDLLHQVIKGTFKDHLVAWVVEYLEAQPNGKSLVAEMDRRIAACPPFPGLRHFPEGRGFKQWTGDDSKALMKVFLPSIVGLVPDAMVKAVSAFTEFCYLVRWSQIDELVLQRLDKCIAEFHTHRQIFINLGICDHFCLPCQHSLIHYCLLIQQFGAPNGLCSSITESKHIKAVKQPWRCSNRNNPLSQMLLTNQRMDKVAAFCVAVAEHNTQTAARSTSPAVPLQAPEFDNGGWNHDGVESEDAPMLTCKGEVWLPRRAGMLGGLFLLSDQKLTSFSPENTVSHYPRSLAQLSAKLNLPLEEHIRCFLYDQQNLDAEVMGMHVDLDSCPTVNPSLRIKVFHSVFALYHAPSDLSGIGGMHREYIRATPVWQGGAPRYDCAYVTGKGMPDDEGFRALHIAQVRLFLSFRYDDGDRERLYECTFVRWFNDFGAVPCDVTNMWRVQPQYDNRQHRLCGVIHIDSILRSAHLIGVYGHSSLPREFHFSNTLTAFRLYYVNKYADYHSYEVAW